jgi:hypothetical protein
MIHTSQQALKAARQILSSNKVKHIEIGAPEPKAGFEYKGGATVTDVWVVSYTYMVFEEEQAFIYLDDRNDLKLIYILTKHGYVT